MKGAFQSVAELTTGCKCCGATARLFGVADFNKNCEESRGRFLAPCGVPIYYHRCPACGFLFTTAMDHFTHEDFKTHVYNDEYPLIDPDFAHTRPATNARSIGGFLAVDKSIRLLDYGGGSGLTCELLRRKDGFTNVSCYDPFFGPASVQPEGKFDCITCLEALEHSPDPRRAFGHILSLLKDPGIVLFSTIFQPPTVESTGVSWPYIAPRNGHVSIYTAAAVKAIVEPMGYRFGSFNPASHVVLREVPAFVRHLKLPVG